MEGTRRTSSVGKQSWQQQSLDQEKFEAEVRRRVGEPVAEILYAKVAGVTYENSDGTRRLPFIRKCKPGECLVLRHDGAVPRFPRAVGVYRQEGGQLGYLDARLADEVLSAGTRWSCFFYERSILIHGYPEDEKARRQTIGATVCIVKLTQ